MLLTEVVRTHERVAATRARREKIAAIAALLPAAAPGEVAVAVAYLSGELPQRQVGVGYRGLRELPPPAAEPVMTLTEVDAAFTAIKQPAGAGSQAARRELVAALFARATAAERAFLVALLTGELRQGALEGVMIEAVAAAAGVPVAEVRRAHLLSGSLPAVAEVAVRDARDGRGVAGLRAFRLEVGRPLAPMLAGSAPDVATALDRVAPAGVEWKIDGIRVQIHRDGEEVAVFTRTLDDITARLPEVVAAARSLAARRAVLDGEVIALRAGGRPHPFQVTASRAGSRTGVPGLAERVPLTTYLFDALHVDGDDLLDEPGERRHAALTTALTTALTGQPTGGAGGAMLIPRIVTADPPAAAAFFEEVVRGGHEGVVVKSLTTPYAAGRRGAGWIKVKPRHTLDLVVLAAEWGHGRRRGWLSNLHLGAYDPAGGGFVMLGKTFKGLTDELLTWQTERLLALATSPTEEWVVRVRPELVVEIAFDGLQASTRYPGGLALRFARVLRYRPDKTAAEADTIDTVRALAPR